MSGRPTPSDKKNDTESNLDASFSQKLGLDSLDPLKPKSFRDVDSESTIPKLESQSKPTSAALPSKPAPKTIADGPPPSRALDASDFLFPFLTTRITHPNRKRLSTYIPCSHFMFYIIHHLNDLLIDNFYFKRSCPEYHPYILRLYFGILFYIQTLRAMNDVGLLNSTRYEFLTRFLDAHPLESLSIPGPLLPLFKTICTSQPEYGNYAKLSPTLPNHLGPTETPNVCTIL